MFETIVLWTIPSIVGTIVAWKSLRLLYAARRRVALPENRRHLLHYLIGMWIAFIGDISGVVTGIASFHLMWNRPGDPPFSVFQQASSLENALVLAGILLGRLLFLLLSINLYHAWSEAEDRRP